MARFIIFIVANFYCWTSFARAMTPTQIYDKTVEITSKNFYDQTFRGLNWSELTQTYRNRISDQSSLNELKVVLNELLGNLKASHTKFLTADNQDYHALQSIFSRRIDGGRIFQCGEWYKQIGHKWFIQNVLANSPMAKAGLISGDEIVSVDGKPFEEIKSCDTSSSVEIKFRRDYN